MRPRSADRRRSACSAGELGHGAFERQHAALAYPVLQGPHRVAAVGVALRVRARVGAAELGGRMSDQLAQAARRRGCAWRSRTAVSNSSSIAMSSRITSTGSSPVRRRATPRHGRGARRVGRRQRGRARDPTAGLKTSSAAMARLRREGDRAPPDQRPARERPLRRRLLCRPQCRQRIARGHPARRDGSTARTVAATPGRPPRRLGRRRSHQVEQVAAHAGVVVGVEHRADDDGSSTRDQPGARARRDRHDVRSPIEQQRARRHGEQAGPGAGTEDVGDGEQLVVGADLAGQRGAAGPDVAGDLVGREPQRTEPQALRRPAPPWPRSPPAWPCARVRRPDPSLRCERGGGRRGSPGSGSWATREPCHVAREVVPVERDGGVDGVASDLLDGHE